MFCDVKSSWMCDYDEILFLFINFVFEKQTHTHKGKGKGILTQRHITISHKSRDNF